MALLKRQGACAGGTVAANMAKRQKLSTSPATSSNWAALPTDILGLILQNYLTGITDHARFSHVCASWNSAVKNYLWHWPKPRLPWLMVCGDNNKGARFCSLFEKRKYRFPLPLPKMNKRVCVGSSHGWLVTVHDLSEMHLLNPVMAIQIQLPSITTLPYVGLHSSNSTLRGYLHKAILSSSPSIDDGSGDFAVILLHNPSKFDPDKANAWQ